MSVHGFALEAIVPAFLVVLFASSCLALSDSVPWRVPERAARPLGLLLALALLALPLVGVGLSLSKAALLPWWGPVVLAAVAASEAGALRLLWQRASKLRRAEVSARLFLDASGACVVVGVTHYATGTLVEIRPGTEALHVLLWAASAAAVPLVVLLGNCEIVFGAPGRKLLPLAFAAGGLLLVLDSHALVGLYPAIHASLWCGGVFLVFRSAAEVIDVLWSKAPQRAAGVSRRLLWLSAIALAGAPVALWSIASSTDTRPSLAQNTPGLALLEWLPGRALAAGFAASDLRPEPQDLSAFAHLRGKLNILLVSVDGLRADYVRAATAPRSSQFAQRAVSFPTAYAQGSKTSIGLSSLLTGRYSAHLDWTDETPTGGLQLRSLPLLPSLLQEQARAHGYATLATLDGDGHDYFSAASPFARGFDQVHVVQSADDERFASLAAARAAIDQRRAVRGKRFFQWIHLFDPHRSFAPSHYAFLVRRADHAVGQILDALEADQQLGQTVVVLTSDHGRSLGEKGKHGHATDLSEHQLRVPLVLHVPGMRPRVVRDAVASIDVTATLAFLIGADSHSSALDGINLMPLAAGHAAPRRLIFSELHNQRVQTDVVRPTNVRAIIDYPYKLVADLERATYVLYDVAQDPQEARPLEGPRRERMASQLAAFLTHAER